MNDNDDIRSDDSRPDDIRSGDSRPASARRDAAGAEPAPLDAGLRLQLRGLHRELAPARDLWPGIAVRIATPARTPSARLPSARPSPRRFAPWALAASLLLAVGMVWQLQSPPAPQAVATPASAQSLDREAAALTREYRAALQELQAAAPAAQAEQPALHELDRSAAQIRSALARAPDARFLLERLRHTYALRLELTQRAALT